MVTLPDAVFPVQTQLGGDDNQESSEAVVEVSQMALRPWERPLVARPHDTSRGAESGHETES